MNFYAKQPHLLSSSVGLMPFGADTAAENKAKNTQKQAIPEKIFCQLYNIRERKSRYFGKFSAYFFIFISYFTEK